MCGSCEWKIYKDDIEMALDEVRDPEFLESVLDWITEHKHITPSQASGVDRWLENI